MCVCMYVCMSVMVLTTREILFSRTKLPFSRTRYKKDLKVINLDMCEKAFDISYDALSTFLWYSLHVAPSNCLIHQLFFKFELTWDIKTRHQYFFPSTTERFLLQT